MLHQQLLFPFHLDINLAIPPLSIDCNPCQYFFVAGPVRFPRLLAVEDKLQRMSTRPIIWRACSQIVIYLYLLDGKTLIDAGTGMGWLEWVGTDNKDKTRWMNGYSNRMRNGSRDSEALGQNDIRQKRDIVEATRGFTLLCMLWTLCEHTNYMIFLTIDYFFYIP